MIGLQPVRREVLARSSVGLCRHATPSSVADSLNTASQQRTHDITSRALVMGNPGLKPAMNFISKTMSSAIQIVWPGEIAEALAAGEDDAGALPHVATDPISDLYHAPGATAGDQATLVLLWQATQGIFDALLVTGLLLLPIGVIALGVAMLGTPAFGKGFGWMSVVIGVLGVAAGVVLLMDPGSPIAIVSVLSLIVFHIALGWKVYSLSRAPSLSRVRRRS
jgi:hypothetical protein